jgi:hypothetical protein
MHIMHIILFTTLIRPYCLFTGFFLFDDDEEMPEDPPVTAYDDHLPDPAQPDPVQQPEISQSSPFDFHGVMRRRSVG